MLSPAQNSALLRAIAPHRVYKAQGQSHVPAFDVIAHLNRVFGFAGWDKEILKLDVVYEHKGSETDASKKGWYVTYRCSMRLTVRDPQGNVLAVREDAATGSAQNQPTPGDAHDMAIKSAVSYALKRCAKDWGDQFGLSLYNGGMTDALVRNTLVTPKPAGDGYVEPVDLEQHAPAPKSMGNDERQYDEDDPERPFSDEAVDA